jgi:hypothetical protein
MNEPMNRVQDIHTSMKQFLLDGITTMDSENKIIEAIEETILTEEKGKWFFLSTQIMRKR